MGPEPEEAGGGPEITPAALVREKMEEFGVHAALACIMEYEKRHGHVALTEPEATDWIMDVLGQLGQLGQDSSSARDGTPILRGFVDQMCILEKAVSEAKSNLNYYKWMLTPPVGPWGFRPPAPA